MEDLTDSSALISNLQQHSPYIQELRTKLFSIIIYFLIGSILGFIFNQKIIELGLKLFNLDGVNVVMTSPFQFVGLSFTIALICGLLASIPALVFRLFQFVKPALHKNEYQLLLKAIPWSIVLFILGFAFGLWIMNFIIRIYASASASFHVGNFWDIQKLFASILMTATLLGCIFQFPIIFTYLMKFGFIHHRDLASKRKIIYVIFMIFVMLLPPVDFFSDIILITPMLLLFELTLLINYKKGVT